MDVASRRITAEIPLNGAVGRERFADSVAMDVKASADGTKLYCADVTNFRVAVVDTRQNRVVGSVRVGRYPYALEPFGLTEDMVRDAFANYRKRFNLA